MSQLRSTHTVAVCVAVLGLLLVGSPIFQALATPCSRAAASETASRETEKMLVSPTADDAQWTCSTYTQLTAVRALPSEPPEALTDGPFRVPSTEGRTPRLYANGQGEPGRASLLSISLVLDALRRVVLLI